jgi:hypothetical protein
MATYLEGVGTYIPALQPYQPNLNLIANVLEKRQNQYDTNYKAINDMYGKYFYADLSREDNLKRKDTMLKQIDLDLKRISGLDLSLSQNANQALQVFKPFYEDSYLMKDMATTKNYKSRRGTAEGLKNSSDKDKQSQYWLTGVKAMDYQMEEFKAMPLEQTLGFQDPTYTPYKNPTEYFTKLAKDADLSIDITRPTPDGMYFVRQKNGNLLIDPLSTLFSSAVSNDPALQAIYATQAYVDRKDNMYANKDKYGGLEQAERAYLTEEYAKLQKFNQQFSEQSQANLSQKKAIKQDVDKAYANDTYTERTDQASAALDESIARNQAVANQAEALNKELSSGKSSSSVTSNGLAENLDIETLRSKVDYGRAVQLMSDDVNASVSALMNKDRVEDIEVNPVGLEDLRHGHRLSEMKQKFNYDVQKMQYKAELDWNAYSTKKLVDNGVLQVNADGTTDYTEEYKNTLLKQQTGDGFFEELEKGDALAANKSYLDFQAKENAPVVMQMLNFYKGQLDRERRENGPNNKTNDVWGAMFGSYGEKRGIEGLISDMKNDSEGTMKKMDIGRAVSVFKNNAQGVYKGMTSAEEILQNPQFLQLESYGGLLEDMDKVDVENTEIARKEIVKGINIKKLAYVDEPFYRLNANDIDAGSQFSQKELNELNTRLGKLMMLNATSGTVTENQFYKNVSADKTKMSNGQTAAQMLKDLNASRRRNDPEGGPIIAGIGTMFYKGKTPTDITSVLYDNYKANWDVNKGKIPFKALHPGTMIPGAGGQIYSLQAGQMTGKTVLPKAYGTPNRTLWSETMKDVRGINFDDATNRISFKGIGKNASDDTARGLQILEAINAQVLKGDGDKFNVYQSQMALGDPKKGAMIVYPTVKQLQDLGLVGGTEADPKTLTQTEAALLAQKGISVIGDKGNFQNWLFKDAFISPMEARMNVAGPDGIKYEDPFGNGYYNITANKGSDNSIVSYNVNGKFKQLNPQTGKEEWADLNRTSVPLGGEIDNYDRNLKESLQIVGKQSDAVFRQLNPKK